MGNNYTVSISPEVKIKLTEYCAKHGKKVGITAERAIDQFLKAEAIVAAINEAA